MGRHRTDLVAYDYNHRIPISVEIESVSEVRSHPEHVQTQHDKVERDGVWAVSCVVPKPQNQGHLR